MFFTKFLLTKFFFPLDIPKFLCLLFFCVYENSFIHSFRESLLMTNPFCFSFVSVLFSTLFLKCSLTWYRNLYGVPFFHTWKIWDFLAFVLPREKSTNNEIFFCISKVFFSFSCFQEIFFVFSFQKFDYDISWWRFFGFILFMICSDSWMCRFKYLGEFSSIFWWVLF